MVGCGFVSIVQYSFYAVRKRRQDNISKEKAAPPREVERLIRLVLDVKRGVPERIQNTGLVLGIDILSNLSIHSALIPMSPPIPSALSQRLISSANASWYAQGSAARTIRLVSYIVPPHPFTIALSPASSRTGIPRALAFSSFEPAASPATR